MRAIKKSGPLDGKIVMHQFLDSRKFLELR